MAIDRTEASQTFDTYVADYDASNPRIALKVDHTYRVAELCARIARSIGLSPDDVDLAWLCGLLHDIGRFEQVRRYDTFNDAKSTSHAALGVEILFGEGRIRDYLPQDEYGDAYDELVRTVVGTHSDFRLPEDLDERTQTFCDILRDADKIDILKATTLSEPEAIFGVSREELLQSELSSAVVDAFYGFRTVRREERVHPADFLVGFTCFVFELVYPVSVHIAREQGHALELLSTPFERPDTARRVSAMRARMREWLQEQ